MKTKKSYEQVIEVSVTVTYQILMSSNVPNTETTIEILERLTEDDLEEMSNKQTVHRGVRIVKETERDIPDVSDEDIPF